jgi:hypothetical protein
MYDVLAPVADWMYYSTQLPSRASQTQGTHMQDGQPKRGWYRYTPQMKRYSQQEWRRIVRLR